MEVEQLLSVVVLAKMVDLIMCFCSGDELTDFKVEAFASDPRASSPNPELCVHVTTPVGLGETKKFPCQATGSIFLTGQWLRVQKGGPKLTLCEVEIIEAAQDQGECTAAHADHPPPPLSPRSDGVGVGVEEVLW